MKNKEKPVNKTDKAALKENNAERFQQAKKLVVERIDRNGDGKLGMKDISALHEELLEKKSRIRMEAERKALCPIFIDDLDKPDFQISKLIRIVEMDKRREESEACVGSIGYESIQKGLRVVSIFPEMTAAFGLTFYPEADLGVYYVDPSDRDHYIALDDYFYYLRIARVSELQRIAQDLGAKHLSPSTQT